MIETRYRKKKTISIDHIWFASDKSDVYRAKPACFYLVHGMDSKEVIPWAIKYSKQSSLVNDLRKCESELWSGISKTYRNEIRRCESSDLYRASMYKGEEILEQEDLIRRFKDTYERMYRNKGMRTSFNLDLFKKYAENSNLIVSIAFKNQTPCVFHSYIVDETNARFWNSCSTFRDDKTSAEEIGRLNKFLHWQDFKKLRLEGITQYDWGGVDFDDPELRGISEFKKKFGGEIVTYNNVLCASNLLIRLCAKMYFSFKER